MFCSPYLYYNVTLSDIYTFLHYCRQKVGKESKILHEKSNDATHDTYIYIHIFSYADDLQTIRMEVASSRPDYLST